MRRVSAPRSMPRWPRAACVRRRARPMHHEPGFFAEPANWVVLAFFLFFLLFGRKLWAALTGMLDQRAVSVRAELDEAARLKSEAEAMLKQAEATRLKAQSDAKAMIEGAAAEAARVAEATRVEAETAGRRRGKMALDRVGAARKQAGGGSDSRGSRNGGAAARENGAGPDRRGAQAGGRRSAHCRGRSGDGRRAAGDRGRSWHGSGRGTDRSGHRALAGGGARGLSRRCSKSGRL